MPTPLETAQALQAEVDKKLDLLRKIDPYLIDLSLRENPVGARMGQTLKNKLDVLPIVREFGFKNILLGTLDYSLPDELEVDDDFMMELQRQGADLTGCFAFTDIGLAERDGTFTPSPSMLKLQRYGVPNTLHEIYLSKEGMKGLYTLQELYDSLPATFHWLNTNVVGDHGGKPRILVNVVDGCDAFMENAEQA